ncbi:hypothetical protein VPH35_108559 [Triticum aestivum]
MAPSSDLPAGCTFNPHDADLISAYLRPMNQPPASCTPPTSTPPIRPRSSPDTCPRSWRRPRPATRGATGTSSAPPRPGPCATSAGPEWSATARASGTPRRAGRLFPMTRDETSEDTSRSSPISPPTPTDLRRRYGSWLSSVWIKKMRTRPANPSPLFARSIQARVSPNHLRPFRRHHQHG